MHKLSVGAACEQILLVLTYKLVLHFTDIIQDRCSLEKVA